MLLIIAQKIHVRVLFADIIFIQIRYKEPLKRQFAKQELLNEQVVILFVTALPHIYSKMVMISARYRNYWVIKMFAQL